MRITLSLLAIFLLPLTSAYGKEEKKQKPLVVLNIKEKIDGKTSKRGYASMFLTSFFQALGFDVYNKQPMYVSKKKRKKFKEYQNALKNKKPTFTIQGTIKVFLDRPITFQGSTQGYVYRGAMKLTLLDKNNQEKLIIQDKHEHGASRGSTNNNLPRAKKLAAKRTIVHLAYFTVPHLYYFKPILNLVSGNKSKIEKRVKAFQKLRTKYKGKTKVLHK
ncbi:MAG: hypothetical protein D6805_03165 [Planctomycetota bacterium]|nr:MAG: hypothetical protein D6805_03165 [Planctomycetota bacterium]